MKQNKIVDVLIIGGGASGMAAAISARQMLPSGSILLLERNIALGKKILATGNGRCNLGNANVSAENYYGSVAKYYSKVFEATTPTEQFFQSMGFLCRTDSEGRMYPLSNQAQSVSNGMRYYLEQQGITYATEQKVTDISHADNLYTVQTETDNFSAKSLIIATGGKAFPASGSDGNLIPVLKRMEIPFTKLSPALGAVEVNEKIGILKGVRLKGLVTLTDAEQKPIATEYGEVQFTDKTVSGICVMNLTAKSAIQQGQKISLDLFSGYSVEQLSELFWNIYGTRYLYPITAYLTGILPDAVTKYLLRKAQIPEEITVSDVLPEQIHQLVLLCKNLSFSVKTIIGWEKAQVTGGGIAQSGVTEHLESRQHKGLFFCGEILDIHGICGGYNLEWAWHSGQLAGKQAAKFIEK